MTFVEFCTIYNLSVHVNERDPETRKWGKTYNPAAARRYYASIPHLEVAESEVIYSSPCGNGNTIQSAIRDLARKMSNQEVRVDHRFIRVPKLKI